MTTSSRAAERRDAERSDTERHDAKRRDAQRHRRDPQRHSAGPKPDVNGASAAGLSTQTNAASRPTGQRFGPGMFAGGPAAKALDFKGSSRRLLRMMTPQRGFIYALLSLGVISVSLSVIGPKILGHATDLIFTGAIGSLLGSQFPAGTTNAEAVARLNAAGQGRFATVVRAAHATPGHGIDFTAVGRVLLVVLILYMLASMFMYVQGRLASIVVQRTVYTMREQVETKLSRLPLVYFDKQPRGELLSRVTNDIDNIAQTLQQSLSQLLTSVLTIVGVLAVMFWISPLLAIVALVTVPLSVFVAAKIGKRAQPQFIAQWSVTGKLNGHIEEMYTGHSLVKVFGRQEESAEVFATHNEKLYGAAFRAQFVSGLIQPAMTFIGNINYVMIAVIGGLKVASGSLSIGDIQAFIQYSRQFSQPITQVASMANLLQSGVASAERVFELLDAPEQLPDPATPAVPAQIRGAVSFEGVSFRYDPDRPLIDDLSLSVEPGQTVAIVGPTGAGKTTLVNLVMRFYEVTGGRIVLDGVDTAVDVPRRAARGDGHGAAGHVAVRRHDRGQHRLRRGQSDPRTHRRGRGRDACRPLRAHVARRLRHRHRRRRFEPVRGREAAHHDRPGVPVRAGDPDPRRGHEFGRHPHRGAHPASDDVAAQRSHELRDRAPALDDPRRRRDPRDGGRPDRREGLARRAARRRRRLRAALPGAVLVGGGGDRLMIARPEPTSGLGRA